MASADSRSGTLSGYEALEITVDTDGSGAGTAKFKNVTGRLIQIEYYKDGSSGYSNGNTFTLSKTSPQGTISFFASASGLTNASAIIPCGIPVYDASGADSGTLDYPASVNSDITCTVAGGGESKTGKFVLVVRS